MSRRLELVSEAVTPAPPERVWAVLTDASRWPAWSSVVHRVDAVPPTWSVGERLAFVLRMGGARVGFDVRLTEVEPGRRVVWSSVRWTVTGTRTHELLPTGSGGTRVRDTKVFEHPWWPVDRAYPTGLIRRMSATWVAELAAEAAR